MPVRAAVGLISHDPLLYRDLTAHENLRFYADMYGLADREGRIGELLERLELSQRRDDLVRTFQQGHAAAPGDRPGDPAPAARAAAGRAACGPRPARRRHPRRLAGRDPRRAHLRDGDAHTWRRASSWPLRRSSSRPAGSCSAAPARIDAAAFAAVYREHVRGRSGGLMGRRQYAAILRKDLIRELRTREMLVSMFLFVMLAHGDLPLRLQRAGRHGPDLLHRRHALGDVHLRRAAGSEPLVRAGEGRELPRRSAALPRGPGDHLPRQDERQPHLPAHHPGAGRARVHALLHQDELPRAIWAPSCSSCCSPTWASARWARCWRPSP